MAFDFKKEYKEFYMPKNQPSIVTVPVMNFVAVRGKGDPNQEDGDYKKAIGLLYGIAFTIKMSKMTIALMVTSITSSRLWKVSGGRMASSEWIMPTRKNSIGSPSSDCQIL